MLEHFFLRRTFRFAAAVAVVQGHVHLGMAQKEGSKSDKVDAHKLAELLLATVAAWWAFWDFHTGAAFISRLSLRLSWLDPTLAKASLFWGLPIGGVALVQLICYSLDRVFLRRRWTSIDLLAVSMHSTSVDWWALCGS